MQVFHVQNQVWVSPARIDRPFFSQSQAKDLLTLQNRSQLLKTREITWNKNSCLSAKEKQQENIDCPL